jgi:long-subunit fatty acid transport protein
MKYLLIILVFTSKINAQFIDSSKFGINAAFGVGTAQLYHSNFGNVSGNSNSLTTSIAYRFNEKISLSSGIGFQYFSGNVVQNNEHANISNDYLQIPLNFTIKSPIFDGIDKNIRFILGFGAYANYLIESKITTKSNEIKSENLGWNLGINGNCGMNFRVKKKTYVSLLIDFNKEFGNIVSNNIKQKMNYTTGLKVNVNHNF